MVSLSPMKKSTPTSQPESLADFVRRVRDEKNLSLTDVERQSGGLITNGYVSRIENGFVLNPSPKKLQALAKGLGISEDQIFAAARGNGPQSEDELFRMMLDELYAKRQEATGSEREFIDGNIRMLLNEMDRRRRA